MTPSRDVIVLDARFNSTVLQFAVQNKKQKQAIAENVNTDLICLVSKPLQNSTWCLLANTRSGTVLTNILHYSFRLFILKLKLFVVTPKFVWISAVAIKSYF